LENLFSFASQPGHKIVFVYAAEFVASALSQKAEIQGHETNGCPYIAQWLSREQIEFSRFPVYPKGIEPWLFRE
ncbi:MAG: NUDIX hydrolase, partial [Acinetobacter sp.]